MAKKRAFNVAYVIALVVTIVLAWFVLMGVDYLSNGEWSIALSVAAGWAVVVALLVAGLWAGKSSRFDGKRKGLQVVCGILLFLVLGAGAFPLTNFLYVWEHEREIDDKIEGVRRITENMDSKYIDYVRRRVASYENALKRICWDKRVDRNRYNRCVALAGGLDDDERIASLKKSLERQLRPDETDSVSKQRQEWMKKVGEIKVWNVFLPDNVKKLNDVNERWLRNYVELSTLKSLGDVRGYLGETEEGMKPFEFEGVANSFDALIREYTTLHAPSPMSILIVLAGYLLIMLPWAVATRDLAGVSSSDGRGVSFGREEERRNVGRGNGHSSRTRGETGRSIEDYIIKR